MGITGVYRRFHRARSHDWEVSILIYFQLNTPLSFFFINAASRETIKIMRSAEGSWAVWIIHPLLVDIAEDMKIDIYHKIFLLRSFSMSAAIYASNSWVLLDE